MSSLQAIQQLVHRRGVELLVVMAVDHDHRRAATGGHAFFLALEVDAAVGGRFAELAAQLLLRVPDQVLGAVERSEEHTSELQSLMRTSYAVFCLKKKTKPTTTK